VKEEAEDAGVSERTLKRAKKVVGVIAYRENEAGEGRGAGRWMWKVPVVGLVEEDVQGGHASVQGGQGVPKENGGPLEHVEGTKTGESCLDKPNVQESQPCVQGGQAVQEVQGGQEGQPLEPGTLEEEITREPSGTPLLSPEEWEEI